MEWEVIGETLFNRKFTVKSLILRIIIILGISGAYALVFFPLFHWRGADVGSLSVFPVIAAGLLLGLRGGLLTGLLAYPLNTLLLNLAGRPGWDAIFRNKGGTGMLALLIVGIAIGLLGDL